MDISAVRIVLVAPAGPLNVGSVARVMKNFGLSQLVLVSPQCDPLSAEALQMAVHAKDVLQSARQVKTVPEALEGCCLAVATTARQRGFNAPLERPESVLPALVAQTKHGSNAALIFGPEDRGLSNEELTYAQRFTKIPSDAAYSALNLAQAVAVCCYELYRIAHCTVQESSSQELPPSYPTEVSSVVPSVVPKETQLKTLRTSPPSATPTESASPAQIDEIEGYYRHLEQVLLKVEYLYSHTAASRMRKFRQLLNRAEPTSQEVAMLRGILRQTEWALSNWDTHAKVSQPTPSSPGQASPEKTDSSQD